MDKIVCGSIRYNILCLQAAHIKKVVTARYNLFYLTFQSDKVVVSG